MVAKFSRQSETAEKRNAVSDSSADVPALLESPFDVAVRPCSIVGRMTKEPHLTPVAANGSSSGFLFWPSMASVRSGPASSFCLSALSMVRARRLAVSSSVSAPSAASVVEAVVEAVMSVVSAVDFFFFFDLSAALSLAWSAAFCPAVDERRRGLGGAGVSAGVSSAAAGGSKMLPAAVASPVSVSSGTAPALAGR
jgi:hypothetical protein